jgi:uncharacterized membrane protein YhaH (DUF805 family)
MITRYNTVSFLWGVPGLIMQIGGYVLRMAYMQGMINGQVVTSSLLMDNVGRAVILVGTIFLFIGLAYYARAKGRSAWWCLFALLSVIGLFVLACLKDRTGGGKGDKPYYGAEK